jgi:hypothetical protein
VRFTPIACAASSPSVSASSAGPSDRRSAQPRAMKGAAIQTWVMERSWSEPIIQKTISDTAKGLGERLSASEVSAPASALIAMPARMSVSDEPLGPARRRISATPIGGAREGEERQAEREGGGQARVDRDDRAERGRARDADESGLGQRVAQVALHRRAREAEARAHHDGEKRAGQPDLAHDEGQEPVLAQSAASARPGATPAGADGERGREEERPGAPPSESGSARVIAPPPAQGAARRAVRPRPPPAAGRRPSRHRSAPPVPPPSAPRAPDGRGSPRPRTRRGSAGGQDQVGVGEHEPFEREAPGGGQVEPAVMLAKPARATISAESPPCPEVARSRRRARGAGGPRAAAGSAARRASTSAASASARASCPRRRPTSRIWARCRRSFRRAAGAPPGRPSGAAWRRCRGSRRCRRARGRGRGGRSPRPGSRLTGKARASSAIAEERGSRAR